jgi:uncharacterized protein (DUF885 family)
VKLADAYWEFHLETHPIAATSIGDRRFDDRLDDITPEGIAARERKLRDFQARAEAIDPTPLSRGDRITRNMLLGEIRAQLALISCDFESWTVDPLGGPQVEFLNVPSYQPLTGLASGDAMIARWRAMGTYLDRMVANLGRGLAAGKTAPHQSVVRVLGEIDDLAGTPIEAWALMKPAAAPPEGWPAEARTRFARELREAVDTSVRPALLRYREFLAGRILPAARDDDHPGIMHVPGGEASYRALITVHTSLDLPPAEIHRIGLEEVARINDAMRGLGKTVLGTDDLDEIHRRLRTDPAMHFATRDEVAAKALEALRRAEAAVPDWFGIRPAAPCRVVRMEPHEEKHSTIAYYREPAADGSRPGSYYINTYAPETRPRYEAEALAFHEAVPGHHLQIAIMQELTGIPAFRRFAGVTAFVEGWGLYSERLADEMGLYSGDLDRIGMLSFDSWRACRLVVDTGMHAMGWTRGEAIDFMIANTVLAENNIANEVDRYITWPGQALAYKLGQREIMALRAEARQRLGTKFDVKGFHDAVLGEGAVDLGTLRESVEAWESSVERGR